MTTFYVDVSHHDWDRKGGNLEWAKVIAATSKCVMARATYGDPSGTHYTTRHFADFINGARAAGATLLGGFHNLIKGDQASINRQVKWLQDELDRLDCNWAMVDIERYPELVNNDMWPRWDDVRQFCDRWRAVDWRMLTVYLPGWLWSNYLGKPDLTVLGWPLIESDYGANTAASPATVYASRGGDSGRGWNATDGVVPSIWQFGSNLVVPGASSKTDVNAFRGSFAELDKLLLHQSDQTPEEPFMAALTDAQQAELYNWAKNVYAGMFKGGPSCGTGVPDAHRASADDSDLGNALFSKVNYVQSAAGVKAEAKAALLEGLNEAASRATAYGRQLGDALNGAIVNQIKTSVGEEAASPAEVQAALAALPVATAEQIAAAVVAALPEPGQVSVEDLTTALRTVLGSVDEIPQP